MGTDLARARPKSASWNIGYRQGSGGGEQEMSYLKLSPLIDEEVLGLEIPVQHSSGVAVGKSSQHLAGQM